MSVFDPVCDSEQGEEAGGAAEQDGPTLDRKRERENDFPDDRFGVSSPQNRHKHVQSNP